MKKIENLLIFAIENTESIVGGCHRRSSHRHSCRPRPVCTPKPVYPIVTPPVTPPDVIPPGLLDD